jgi:lipopolysaccharide export system protein LptC
MSITPLPRLREERRLPRERMLNHAGTRMRRIPTRGDLLRRRLIVSATKYVLPLVALALLTAIAMWPQIDRAREQARVAFRRMSAVADGATVADARYRSVDERGRPFTVTASNAVQISPERVDLTAPKGDITLENGTWAYLEARQGIFLQRIKQLDLAQDVTLYRDDGMTLHTETAAIDLRASAAAGADAVHVEGPTGTLDAAGFALVDKGDTIQFGPGRSVLNAASHAPEPTPAVDPEAMPDAAPAPPALPPPVHDIQRHPAPRGAAS